MNKFDLVLVLVVVVDVVGMEVTVVDSVVIV